MKISFTDWSGHIYLPSLGWEWDRPDAFPYLGQVLLPRWASPRWAQEFRNHRNMVGRASKSPVRGAKGCNAGTFSGRVVLCPWSTTLRTRTGFETLPLVAGELLPVSLPFLTVQLTFCGLCLGCGFMSTFVALLSCHRIHFPPTVPS